jgi:hypothetical protein
MNNGFPQLPGQEFSVISLVPNPDNPNTLSVGAMKYGLPGMTQQRRIPLSI